MSIGDHDKDFIREYVAAAESDTEATARREECSAVFGISLPAVRAITAWTTIRAKRATGVSAAEETSIAQPIFAPLEEAPRGGEHVDYDSEIKGKWRKTMQSFIDRHTDPRHRSHMRVLCLPGKQCLEIPVYTELGFRPENIVGVEGGDASARDTFIENATQFGIKPVVGDLEEYLSTTNDPFDVVSYDFLGPSCQKYENIVSATPLREDALLLLNLMMKRETRSAQFLIQAHSHAPVRQIMKELDEAGKKSPVEIHKVFRAQLYASLSEQKTLLPIGEMRAGSLACYYGQRVGQRRIAQSLFRDKLWILDAAEPEQIQSVFDRTANAIEEAIHQFRCAIPKGMISMRFRGIIAAAWHRLSLLTAHEEWKYISRVGQGSSPFHSVFMQFHTPNETYRHMQHSVKLMIDVAEHAVKTNQLDREIRVQIVDKHFAAKQAKANLAPSDHIRILDEDGLSITSLLVKRLLNDTDSYKTLSDQDLKLKLIAGSYTPQIREIE